MKKNTTKYDPEQNESDYILAVLDKIIDDHLDHFKKSNEFKVRPGYSYDKFYLDRVQGSFDQSLNGLIHHIMFEDGIYKELLEKIKEDPELMNMMKNVLGKEMKLRDELAQIIKYNEIGFILIIDKMSDEFKEIEYYISKIMNKVILIVFQSYEEKGEEKRKYTPLTDLNKLSQHNNSTITKMATIDTSNQYIALVGSNYDNMKTVGTKILLEAKVSLASSSR